MHHAQTFRTKSLQWLFHFGVATAIVTLGIFSFFIKSFWVIALGSLTVVLFTYANILWLLPRFLLRGKYLVYSLSLLGFSFLSSYLGFGIWVKSGLDVLQISVLVLSGVLLQWIPVTLALLFQENKNRRKMAEFDRLQMQQELHYLKLQLNPHFLFNALNSLYSLALIKSDKAPEIVSLLAGLMRYLLDTDKVQSVPLEQEIAYLSNYIGLEKIRFHEQDQITFTCQGDLNAVTVPPGLLFPLVENAFKYAGASQDGNFFIQVILSLQEQDLFFEVTNSKRMQAKEIFSAGTGLQNLRRRLNLFYPGRSELKCSEDRQVFKGMLWIKL